MKKEIKSERVIFRLEYDPYMEMEKVMACFPDDETLFGRIGSITMWFDSYDEAVFESYDEADLGYYYDKTKPLKDKALAEKCKDALEARFETKFRIVRKRL